MSVAAGSSRQSMDHWQIIKNRLWLIILCFLLVFAVAAILTYIMPRKYMGRLEMVIERTSEDVKIIGNKSSDFNNPSESFIKTQFEIINKRRTLDSVVKKLELDKKWKVTPAVAAGRLKANLDPRNSMRSDFITLDYYDEDPELAAQIANEIANSYKVTRLEADSERISNALKHLEDQIAAKAIEVQKARDHMLEVKSRLGIVEAGTEKIGGGFSGEVATVEGEVLQSSTRDIYKLEQDINGMKIEIEQLQQLEGDDLIRRAGELKVDNETIKNYGPQYQNLELDRTRLIGEGLGNKHPEIKKIDELRAKTREILLDAAQVYRTNLNFKLQTSEKQLENSRKMAEDHRTRFNESQVKNQEFVKAEQDWSSLHSELLKLKETVAQEQLSLGVTKTPVTVYQHAEPQTYPAKPNVKLNLILGAVMGLALGLALAFFLEFLDTSVKSIDDVERLLGVPVLAVIPKNVGLLHDMDGMPPDAEAYRILRTNIEFNRPDPQANVISVVSGGAGEGKSTTMVNLATVCAQGGYTTLIIDGDLRRPRIHNMFNVNNQVGLSSFLSQHVPLEEVVIRTPIENLYLLPSGPMPADSAGLLNSKEFKSLLLDLKTRFDVILIDSPPILGVSDASVLAAEADMTMIVVQHRKLPLHMLQRVKNAVDGIGGKVLGVVLNNVDIRTDTTYGYYTNYYSYYSSDTEAQEPVKRRRSNSAKKYDAPLENDKAVTHEDVF